MHGSRPSQDIQAYRCIRISVPMPVLNGQAVPAASPGTHQLVLIKRMLHIHMYTSILTSSSYQQETLHTGPFSVYSACVLTLSRGVCMVRHAASLLDNKEAVSCPHGPRALPYAFKCTVAAVSCQVHSCNLLCCHDIAGVKTGAGPWRT